MKCRQIRFCCTFLVLFLAVVGSIEAEEPSLVAFRAQFRNPRDARSVAQPAAVPDVKGLDLPAMVELEWRTEDGLCGETPNYTEAIQWHLPLAEKLLADLQQGDAKVLAREAAELARIAEAAQSLDKHTRELYLHLRQLKRQIALSNPLVQFERLLFIKSAPTRFRHFVMQHFGVNADQGGGLFVLDKPGHSLTARDILEGKMEQGCIKEPSLSYDGKRIVFAWVDLSQPIDWKRDVDSGFFHLWTVNADGTNLRQITRGPYDDMMPCWLPDGDIVFCSTRRKGHARCFGGRMAKSWSTYTLHRVSPDGADIRCLSYHETNELYPNVAADGQIVYTRWDYVDRSMYHHHNLWLTRPDGTNPVALWGNGVWSPRGMSQAKAIPGSQRLVFVGTGHHFATGGGLALLDPSVDNFNDYAALELITPDTGFPESIGSSGGRSQWYCSPWPLSETYYLVAFSPVGPVAQKRSPPTARNVLGLHLLDRFGNREPIYRDPEISSLHPIPLRPRPAPPVLPSQTDPAQSTGVMVVSNVYEGLGDVPRGTIKELRIVQFLPNRNIAKPQGVGAGAINVTRAILGTVPVEADGSACFEVPAGKPIGFQAMTADGFAYRRMRSLTYVQPGERVSCIGCHERTTTAVYNKPLLALQRAPSKIEPGSMGGSPFSFIRFVQPILDKHCVRCHDGQAKTEPAAATPAGTYEGPAVVKSSLDLTSAPDRQHRWSRSYSAFMGQRDKAGQLLVQNTNGPPLLVLVTPPGGPYCAMNSGLVKLLKKGHYKVELSDDEMRRLAAWIDLNALFYGSYERENQEKELRGEALPMPELQ